MPRHSDDDSIGNDPPLDPLVAYDELRDRVAKIEALAYAASSIVLPSFADAETRRDIGRLDFYITALAELARATVDEGEEVALALIKSQRAERHGSDRSRVADALARERAGRAKPRDRRRGREQRRRTSRGGSSDRLSRLSPSARTNRKKPTRTVVSTTDAERSRR